MRVLLVCERLADRDDEGIKNVARHLLTALATDHDVLALSPQSWPEHEAVVVVRMNRCFLNADLLRHARRFKPHVILYVPWTSGTPRTFLRGRILQLGAGAPLAVLLTQPYTTTATWDAVIRLLKPRLVLAMDPAIVEQFQRWGTSAEFVPGGVDLDRFHLPTPEQRAATRLALGVRDGERLVLHVGHLNSRRLPPQLLASTARGPKRRVILVGSPDTPQDAGLVEELTAAGCAIVREYLPDIERYYGAADVYFFPTTDDRSCIGVPLSILEALACGVPVVTSRFGGLPRLFPSTPWVRFVGNPGETERAIDQAPDAPDPLARELVVGLDWTRIAARVAAHLERLRGDRSTR